MSQNVTIAIAHTFFEAYAKLSPGVQRQTRKFIDKFRNDPTHHSIDYEPIQQLRNSDLRTVRITQDYRGIVYHPARGNVYVLLWVDGHDKAHRWAAGKQVERLANGAMQVVDVSFGETEQETGTGFFTAERFDDAQLLRLNVPAVLIPSVRGLTMGNFDEIRDYLPQEAAEALVKLMGGTPYKRVIDNLERVDNVGESGDNLAQSLKHPDSQRRFMVVEAADDVDFLLDESQKTLAVWRISLHPDQQKLVDTRFSAPARVYGGAGTGKTVVAMHRANRLAQTLTGQDKVLFLTRSAQLRDNISDQLSRLCHSETFKRIDVKGLTKWTRELLRPHLNGRTLAKEDEIDALWPQVMLNNFFMPFTTQQVKQEWDKVVRPNNITTESAYLAFARTGQGTRLTRDERQEMWLEIERFRRHLDENGIVPPSMVVTLVRELLENGTITHSYQHVIVDEVQEFSAESLRLVRALLPERENDLFLVGDPYQRTGGFTPVPFKQCEINITGRSRTLTVNYRTTEKIRLFAEHVLNSNPNLMTDDEKYDRSDFRSFRIGDDPMVIEFKSGAKEREFICNSIDRLLEKSVPANTICIIVRYATQLRKYRTWFEGNGRPYLYLKRGVRDVGNPDSGIRMATMQYVKGLEFTHVFISGATKAAIPYRTQRYSEESLQRERQLLHVACTRARDELTVTSVGTSSIFLQTVD